MHGVVALLLAVAVGMVQGTCNDPSLRKPLTTPPAPIEVVAFTARNNSWRTFDLSVVTTIMAFGASSADTDLVCTAHAKGVRVVPGIDFDKNQLTNTTAVDAFVAATRERVKEMGFDGVNIDIEGNSGHEDALTSLVGKLAKGLREDNPAAQITFDFSIYAAGGYDYKSLIPLLNFFIPMGYDMCWGTRVARPNSPIAGLQEGLSHYAKLGALHKLVLGLPWYGFNFVCEGEVTSPGTPCKVTTPFGGGSWQVCFDKAVEMEPSATIPPAYTDAMDARYFTTVDKGVTKQMWYDDSTTLKTKYALVQQHSLHGVAFWTADCANAGTPGDKAMWAALHNVTAAH